MNVVGRNVWWSLGLAEAPLPSRSTAAKQLASIVFVCVCECGHVVFIGTVRLHESWVYKLPSKEVLQLYKRGPGLTVFWISGSKPKIKLDMETAFCFKTRFQRKLCCLLRQLGTCVDNWDPLQGANDHWIVAFCISSWAQKIPVWSSKPSALGDLLTGAIHGGQVIYLARYLYIFIYIYIYIYLSIYLSISLSLSIHVFIYLSSYLSTYLPINLSSYLAIHLSIYLSNYLTYRFICW